MLGYFIAGGILALIIFWAIGSYNSLIKLRNRVEEAFSTMDVYLKKRYDLVPNLVETVKGYAKHESSTLERVIAARNTAMGAGSPDEKLKAEGELTTTLRSLFAVAEAYPDLKANTNFTNLQNQLTRLEEDISHSRKFYNGIVRAFNTAIEVFPKSIIAGIFKFQRKPMFEIESEERRNVKVEF